MSSDGGQISVVVPAFNAGRHLPRTLEGIFAQTYENLEVIVVDDGSTDDTRERATSLGKPNLRYVRIENSGGPARPRNVGVQQARGEYVLLCDADDYLLSDLAEAGAALLSASPSVGMTCTDFTRVDGRGGRSEGLPRNVYRSFHALPRKRIRDDLYLIRQDAAFECLLEENFVRTSGVMLRTAIVKELGGFDESLPNGDDRDMWLRVTRVHDLGFVSRVCSDYLMHTDSVTGRGARNINAKIRVLAKQLDPAMDRELRRKIDHQLALNFRQLGYSLRTSRQRTKAAQAYLRSLRHQVSWSAFRGLGATLMSPKR